MSCNVYLTLQGCYSNVIFFSWVISGVNDKSKNVILIHIGSLREGGLSYSGETRTRFVLL